MPLNPSNAPGFLIRRLQQASVQIFAEKTREAGLSTVQYGALQVIDANPGIDQVRLSQGIDTDRTTITRVVHRLHQLGLITRRSNPKDRRSNSLRITPRGGAVLEAIADDASASQERLMSPLNAAEQAEFMRMLRKLVFAHSDLGFTGTYAAAPAEADEAPPVAPRRRAAAGGGGGDDT